MPRLEEAVLLQDYNQFDGLHWETGSVHSFFAYRGFTAPHTGEPFSEALLMGVSGGAVMGYFSFAYEGYDPHVAILTRNTFDPLETLLARLGVEQTVLQTGSPDRAVTNLVDPLAAGDPAIVWADMYSLPYNALPQDEGMWQMYPIVVYEYEPEADRVWIADRASVPLTVTPDELARARGRVKKLKHRVLTLDSPNPDKLSAAVQKGIWDCIKLYTEGPPKGSRKNFGFAAYERWADLLVKPRQRLSWDIEFPPGRKLYAGLTSTFSRVALFGQNGQDLDAERRLYADFLDEAAVLLERPALQDAAQQFRRSGDAWRALALALLPDEVPPFKETRELMLNRHRAFREQGGAALDEIRQMDARLDAIKGEMATAFPLDEGQVEALQQNLRTHVLEIHDLEREAVRALQEAMG
jgi:hypothetical protein